MGFEKEPTKPYVLHVFTQDGAIVDTMSDEKFKTADEGDFFPNRGQFTVKLRSREDESRFLDLYSESYDLREELQALQRETSHDENELKRMDEIRARLDAIKGEMSQIEIK